ncbi:hypothetical protein, partial [Pseudomonas chlororaphis]|uniref:hypothetical protein n=1 Tax=Pseudomonas chlororaphis TaxID=587753 RepID=UPI003C1D56F4
MDEIEGLVRRGLEEKDGQHLRWLNQAPIPLAMKAFIDEGDASVQPADALPTSEPHQICLLWFFRFLS